MGLDAILALFEEALELERELNRVPLDAPLLKGRQHLQYPHRDFASLAASASRSSGLGQLLKKL